MTITHDQLAERVRQARETAEFTQDDVARALGISRPAVAQLEAGNRRVNSVELSRLARLFGRAAGDFLADEFDEDGVTVILRALADARKDPKVQDELSKAMAVARQIVNLEGILGVERVKPTLPTYRFRRPKGVWDAVVQGNSLAQQERQRLQLGTEPIEDLPAVIESHGVLVFELKLPETVSGFTFRFDQNLACALNTGQPSGRQKFSLAHELCHALCDVGPADGVVTREDSEKDLRETRANAFAAAFLMPERAVRAFLAGLGKGLPGMVTTEEGGARRREIGGVIDPWDAFGLARYFGTTPEAAIWRLKAIGLVDDTERNALSRQVKGGLGPRLDRRLEVTGTQALERALAKERTRRLPRAQTRLLLLAHEALRRDEISRRKFMELADLAGLTEDEICEIPLTRRTYE